MAASLLLSSPDIANTAGYHLALHILGFLYPSGGDEKDFMIQLVESD